MLLALRGFSLVEIGAACLSLAVSAVGYNLQSGTREAITYEHAAGRT
ncbi:MAG: hypothetical protein K2P15_05720 [Oscillospiraceae bacterium]|nr:hypothetical protein [Oscillospiraceae bacterium]